MPSSGLGIAVDSAGAAYLSPGTPSPRTSPPPRGRSTRSLNGGATRSSPSSTPPARALPTPPTWEALRQRPGSGIAVDSAGAAYVTGDTSPRTSPPPRGPSTRRAAVRRVRHQAQPRRHGPCATPPYLGGSSYDERLRHRGRLGGGRLRHRSHRLGTTSPPPRGPSTRSADGGFDVFVTKLNPAGSGLAYSTYLGGSSSEVGFGIAVDSAGAAYLTGRHRLRGLPHHRGGLRHQRQRRHLTRSSPSSTPPARALSTPPTWAGPHCDAGSDIAVDSAGAAYVTGRPARRTSPPPRGPSTRASTAASFDAFVTKLSTTNPTITGGPIGITNDPTPTFTFVSSIAGSTFQCRLDAAAYSACHSPKTIAHLADGPHTFHVRAKDSEGNVEPNPASRGSPSAPPSSGSPGTGLVVTAAPGAKDNLQITRPSASIFRVTDFPAGAYRGSGVHTGFGCTRSGDYTANCLATAITPTLPAVVTSPATRPTRW